MHVLPLQVDGEEVRVTSGRRRRSVDMAEQLAEGVAEDLLAEGEDLVVAEPTVRLRFKKKCRKFSKKKHKKTLKLLRSFKFTTIVVRFQKIK